MTDYLFSTADYANLFNGFESVNNLDDSNASTIGYNYIYDTNSSYTDYYTPLDNITKPTNSSDTTVSFILPWWRQVLWSILFGGMVIVSTGGNLIVIWIVLAHKRMRTVTNYFIVNLSIADAMVSTLNVTFNYIYMLNSHWPFGLLYCKISQFAATLSICASVFTLMAIAIDRYMAIMNPLRPRMGKRTTLCIAGAIWVVGIIVSCPNALFFTTYTHHLDNGEHRIICYLHWPDGQTNHSQMEYVYNVVFTLMTYFVPIGSMTFTYARVGLELWGSQSIGECTQRQLDNIKSKRRVVKMMMVVVLIFAVCWLPFQIYFIITSYYPEIPDLPYIQEIYLAIYWLAMSNAMYNPIIYCWMNHRFRRGFKQFFRWCPFVHLTPEVLQRREVVTSRYSCSGSPDHNRIIRNDTERSFLYTCPGSPKHHRLSQTGSVRIPLHLSTTCHNHHSINHQSFNPINNTDCNTVIGTTIIGSTIVSATTTNGSGGIGGNVGTGGVSFGVGVGGGGINNNRGGSGGGGHNTSNNQNLLNNDNHHHQHHHHHHQSTRTNTSQKWTSKKSVS